jgi:hypothetical protein
MEQSHHLLQILHLVGEMPHYNFKPANLKQNTCNASRIKRTGTGYLTCRYLYVRVYTGTFQKRKYMRIFLSRAVLQIRDVLSRISDPDSTIFSSRIRIQTLFHPGSQILQVECKKIHPRSDSRIRIRNTVVEQQIFLEKLVLVQFFKRPSDSWKRYRKYRY